MKTNLFRVKERKSIFQARTKTQLDEDIKPSGRHLVFRNPPHGVKGQENACQKEEDALRKGLFEGHRKDGL